MIIEWLLSLAGGVVEWFASLFPTDWQVPEFLVNLDETVNAITDNIDGIGAWVDWTFILVVVAAVASLWLIALGIKVIRALIAHVPFFGGRG